MTWRTTAVIWVIALALFYALGKQAHGAEGPYSELEMRGLMHNEYWVQDSSGNLQIHCCENEEGTKDLAAALNMGYERRTHPRHAKEEGGMFVPPNSQKIIDCTGTLTPCTDNP